MTCVSVAMHFSQHTP